jgi:hypothetical protein
VLRARPRGMFLGAFFDVPNLTEVAAPGSPGSGPPIAAPRRSSSCGSSDSLGPTTVGASFLPSLATGCVGAATRSALTSKRRQKPRKERAFSLGNELERYRPFAR